MAKNADLVKDYFTELHDVHTTGGGVAEQSYYGALSNLINSIGKTFKPQVKCIIQLINRGAGHPDGGLFTKEQWSHGNAQAPLLGQMPSRGVIEIKPTSDDTWLTAESKQVSKYWNKYQLVLVTNYRDFLLIGRDPSGKPAKLESYRLASSENDFWKQIAHPLKYAHEHGDLFTEYLKRAMLQVASLSSPKDLAWFLASYARTAAALISGKDIPVMQNVRTALETALGLRFEGEKGEHFFRSTLVQTIFYGLFSAWVLWSKKYHDNAPEYFDWRKAVWHLQVPVMQALFEQIVIPSHIGPLGLEGVLDWTGATLNRVDRSTFFSVFEEGQAVQYFYEPFLEAFDPELRKELGVWYTPPEIVQYMVSRVDMVLKEELKIPDGLADPNVYVLDPCCGTGSYLIEVLKHIYQTLKSKGEDALLASDVKQAALKRVFGFEILPAPFVVSHMQLGLLLLNLGAPLSDQNHDRAGIYLTNALTGWEPLDKEKEQAFQAMFAELKEEQIEARRIKQQVPILVILGNPPYNAFAGTASTKEERDSITPYKVGLFKKWGIKKYNLDELYVRFFRVAERRIAEQTGRGIVCFISSFSYLSDPSFVVMRQRFLREYDRLWFDNMNGDSRETGKRTPEGNPDPSVFSTEYNKAGIRLGTAVSLLVRKTKREEKSIVRFRQFWGSNKRADLLSSLNVNKLNNSYIVVPVKESNRYSLRPEVIASTYENWPSVCDLAKQQPLPAFMESRRGALIDMDRSALQGRMNIYFDTNLDWQNMKTTGIGLSLNAARFDAEKARSKIISKENYDQSCIRRYALRPFDTRWCYYTPKRPLWNEPRPELFMQYWHGNSFIVTRLKTEKEAKGSALFFSRCLVDCQSLARNVSVIPFSLQYQPGQNNKVPKEQPNLITPEESAQIISNLSTLSHEYLSFLGIDYDGSVSSPTELIWMHALAIGYSPSYLSENADGIRKNWPRIPLPDNKDLLESSAALGREIAKLLDTEDAVSGVTVAPLRSEFKVISVISKVDGGQLKQNEMALTTGWGHRGQKDIVMPGKGKLIERDYKQEEKQAISQGAEKLGISSERVLELLGNRTYDIYLNDVAYWKNIPFNVWSYYIGGYQVIKKWLSYREIEIIGRPLSIDEVREVMNMARRIAAIILLQPSLDKNYSNCKENTYAWPT